MRFVVSDFIRLDGVVQAPGGPDTTGHSLTRARFGDDHRHRRPDLHVPARRWLSETALWHRRY